MNIWEYGKDHGGQIGISIFCYGLIFMIAVAFHCPTAFIIFFSVLFFVAFATIFFWGLFRKKRFYDELFGNLEGLDQKYLVTEMLPEPDFYEGKLFFEALCDIDKSMCENVKKYKENMDDFREYIEMWVHEVKLPIASLLLMCHNNREMLDRKYMEQIRRMDQYTDQVLYYVRSEHAEKDYLIKDVNLQKAVAAVAVKNREDLLERKIDFQIADLNQIVYTDGKWLEFVLNQIINNSMKYQAQDRPSSIKIFAEEDTNSIILHIWDNGIGISQGDLPCVFNKSFTGENGRTRAKSTGMGLYIVKQLCDRLGHKIEIYSEKNQYTEIKIWFGKHDFFFSGNLTKL